MTSRSDVQPDKHGNKSYLVDSHAKTNMPHSNKCPLEPDGVEDEDEEEDVDFNPFLIGSPSAEACSSLSSEADGFDADVVDSTMENVLYLSTHSSSHQICNRKSHSSADAVKGKVALLQRELSFLQGGDGETSSRNSKKRKSTSVSGSTDGPVRGKDNGSSSGTEVVSNVLEMELKSPDSKKPVIDFNDDDAICKRTRARYSLTSITLDELESFLQETDDDDDLQHIDDEEEYRKFLAAVLQGGPQDDHMTLEEGNDEDEDNDADFEIEIEEALESDLDLVVCCLKLSSKDVEGRRPETRQNKRNNSSKESKMKLSELAKRPLRPLLPVLPTAPVAPNPSMNGGYLMPEAAHSLSSPQDYLVNEFLPCQIGQLYSLIYEHVQLLIQVYSLSVLEPSRHQIASQIQGLLSEMVQKRAEILTKKSVPHPSFCFDPQYFHSLQTDGLGLDSSGSSRKNDDTGGLSSSACSRQASGTVLHADGVSAQSTLGPPGSSHDIQGLSWLPFAGGPVFSVLDVAPLKFVGKYIDDISTAVQEHQRSFLDATTNIYLEKEPLFPLPVYKSITEIRNTAESSGQLSSPSTQSPSKKTLAATLIENTKKQCVALVPKPIARLVLQFYPLLNPVLFPRKPPSLQVTNRFLFTDAEDELLAMGLMEYNSDWKAIQQRFLPCKSKHQIFVRQKNRCSSKAPDNPIKAVRRMKTAPLTEEEKASIHEGLNVFKLDWMSIWKFVVPYRDPSLLPRQWRIATGTQKSYKMDSAKKEKRRLYEFNKRTRNAATGSSPDPEKEAENAGQRRTGDHSMGNDHEAYVHEGFLADWRPPYTRSVSSAISAPLILFGSLPAPSSARVEMVRSELSNGNLGQSSRGHTHELATSFKNTCGSACGTSNTVQIGQTPRLTLNEPVYRRYRARRFKSSQMVKLAPDLPPVNLPPSVRIISQAAFRNSHDGRSVEKTGSGPSLGDRPPLHVAAKQNASKMLSPKLTLVPSQEPALLKRGNGPDSTGSDLQMHPLLFQTTEGVHLPYYPLNCSGRALSSFTFLPINAPQTNLQNPCGGRGESTCSRKSVPTTSGLDFHPLLRRGGIENHSAIVACPTATSSIGPKGSGNALRTSQTVGSAGKSATEYVDNAKSTPSLGANGLNLEINLNYAPSKEKDSGRKGWIQGNLMASPVSALHSDDGAIGIQGIQANNSRGIDCEDTMYSESLLEIVMEQEELSDSDDEIEEVEFECEEMEDSEVEEEGEGEGEGGSNAQNEDNSDASPVRDGRAQLIVCLDVRKDNLPSCSHYPISEDDGASSPWLSLSSHAPHATLPTRAGNRTSGNLPR